MPSDVQNIVELFADDSILYVYATVIHLSNTNTFSELKNWHMTLNTQNCKRVHIQISDQTITIIIEILLGPLNKNPLHNRKLNKAKWQHNNPIKMVNYTSIA